MSEQDAGVPVWWLVVFLLLVLGAGAATVLAVGGSLVGGVALPVVA